MDPLIGNGIDPELLRVIDRRGQERDSQLGSKRTPAPEPPAEEKGDGEEAGDNPNEADADSLKHELDDLA